MKVREGGGGRTPNVPMKWDNGLVDDKKKVCNEIGAFNTLSDRQLDVNYLNSKNRQTEKKKSLTKNLRGHNQENAMN